MTDHLPAVLDRIDADLEKSLERLFAFIRIPSISTDPTYKEECRRAAEWLAAELRDLGFDASARITRRPPDGRRPSCAWRRRAACAVLRALRCAAGRSHRAVGHAALRADAGGRSQWRHLDRRKGRVRRQGRSDDLHRGLPGLEGRVRRPSHPRLRSCSKARRNPAVPASSRSWKRTTRNCRRMWRSSATRICGTTTPRP